MVFSMNNLLLIFFIDNLNICLVVLKYTLTSQSGDTNTDPTWYHFSSFNLTEFLVPFIGILTVFGAMVLHF
jgi:hypothetical protein